MLSIDRIKETYRTEFNGILRRRVVEFEDKTAAGETVAVEIIYCWPDAAGYNKNSLPVLWHNHGYTKDILPSYLCINPFATQENGMCYGFYNPQEKTTVDGKRREINFEYMFAISDKNEKRLLQAVANMANKGQKNL